MEILVGLDVLLIGGGDSIALIHGLEQSVHVLDVVKNVGDPRRSCEQRAYT